MRRPGHKSASVLAAAIIACVAIGCTSTHESSPGRSAAKEAADGVDILAAADEHGAVVLDGHTGELVGIRRGSNTEAWRSTAGYGRIYYWCDPQCPAVIASGAYTVAEGDAPPGWTVQWGPDRVISDNHEDLSTTLAVTGEDRIRYASSDGEGVLSFPAPTGQAQEIRVSVDAATLWFPSRDKASGLLRLGQGQSYLFTRDHDGWQSEHVTDLDPTVACMDGHHVVMVEHNRIYLNGGLLGAVAGGDVGACDTWGKYILFASFSSSTKTGSQTSVMLWTTSGQALWAATFNGLSVPALLSADGSSIIVSDGQAQALDRRGHAQSTVEDAVDAKVTGPDTAAILNSHGEVSWHRMQ